MKAIMVATVLLLAGCTTYPTEPICTASIESGWANGLTSYEVKVYAVRHFDYKTEIKTNIHTPRNGWMNANALSKLGTCEKLLSEGV